jgi:hypothetical protein
MIIFQKLITRQDVQRNPNCLYLFGDNAMRSGFGGQAKEMRGEPNAHGIRTKKAPTLDQSAYLTDVDYEIALRWLVEDFERPMHWLSKAKPIVIPLDGLGTGLAQLPTRAPRIYDALQRCICGLQEASKSWDDIIRYRAGIPCV